MLGSLVAGQVVYDALMDTDAVREAVEDRVFSTMAVPSTEPLPALIFYPEDSRYDGPMGSRPAGRIGIETMTYALRLLCEGSSVTPILAAHKAQLVRLDNLRADRIYDDVPYFVSIWASGGYVPDTITEGTAMYRQLGTRYRVEITRGD